MCVCIRAPCRFALFPLTPLLRIIFLLLLFLNGYYTQLASMHTIPRAHITRNVFFFTVWWIFFAAQCCLFHSVICTFVFGYWCCCRCYCCCRRRWSSLSVVLCVAVIVFCICMLLMVYLLICSCYFDCCHMRGKRKLEIGVFFLLCVSCSC